MLRRYTCGDSSRRYRIKNTEDSKRNGKGTNTNAAGFKYVGEHKDNKIHGQGTLILIIVME
jgi:hypothetical protein